MEGRSSGRDAAVDVSEEPRITHRVTARRPVVGAREGTGAILVGEWSPVATARGQADGAAGGGGSLRGWGCSNRKPRWRRHAS